jgi:hypothetical protein
MRRERGRGRPTDVSTLHPVTERRQRGLSRAHEGRHLAVPAETGALEDRSESDRPPVD